MQVLRRIRIRIGSGIGIGIGIHVRIAIKERISMALANNVRMLAEVVAAAMNRIAFVAAIGARWQGDGGVATTIATAVHQRLHGGPEAADVHIQARVQGRYWVGGARRRRCWSTEATSTECRHRNRRMPMRRMDAGLLVGGQTSGDRVAGRRFHLMVSGARMMIASSAHRWQAGGGVEMLVLATQL